MDKTTEMSLTKGIDQLSLGLLTQFEGLLELDTDVSQLLIHQDQFTEKFLQDLDSCDHEMVKEFSDMMKKMDLYRLKVKAIKNNMTHITNRVRYLKDRSIKIQEHQIKIASDKVNERHFEESLIPRNNFGSKKFNEQ